MECITCGKAVEEDKGFFIGNKFFCSLNCKKIYNYYELEDKIINYCNAVGNHCGICPIERECSIFMEIEKQICNDEDIIKFDIPIINHLNNDI